MPFDWFVAVRFLKEGRSQTLLILVGVAFGVGVMVFLSALISGLQTSLIKQTLGAQAHVVVRPQEDRARVLPGQDDAQVAAHIEKSSQRTASIPGWQPVFETITPAIRNRGSGPCG